MTESQLIQKIQELKKIQPRENWVVLTKKDLFREECPVLENKASILDIFSRLFLNYKYKPALATFVIAGIFIITALVFAQKALPGDPLYALKRIAEKGKAVVLSQGNNPQAQLELANKRLEELAKIAETNQVRKLSPAISEFQASASQAAKGLKAPKKITKEVVEEAKKLEDNKAKIESLGVIIEDTEELNTALAELVEREIKDLESRTLTEDQQKVLETVRKSYEEENYTGALEEIVSITFSNSENSDESDN